MDATTGEKKAWLTLITDRLLPRLMRQNGEPAQGVRIWSMGCQTADEALVLLLNLLQRQHISATTCPTSSSAFWRRCSRCWDAASSRCGRSSG